MILASDVVAFNGRTLISRGVIIQEKHLSILKKWGIAELDIYDSDETDTKKSINIENERELFSIPEYVPDTILSSTVEKCSQSFKLNNLSDPLTREFFRLAVGYSLKNHPDVKPFDVV
ncbi:MAG: hypothetical protein COV66_03710 [Nitrospinae bacterium CG11_big_fil_rev_8_21_14_0_20_45_15]|nr:MAG: hypothetical protein COV66_03710 [Nitrospinae bacterium CG11_big_fil_rev_8_21_14_0_20_45_15]